MAVLLLTGIYCMCFISHQWAGSEKGTSHKIVTLLLVSMRWQITDGQARTDSYENSLGDSGSLGISRVHLDRNTMISRWSMKLLYYCSLHRLVPQ